MKPAGKIPDDLDHPFWGLREDDGSYPEKSYLFRTGDNVSYALEDFFQHNGVFVSMYGDRRAHSDSYGTCVEHKALDRCLDMLDEGYKPTAADWTPAVRYWLTNYNMQPPLRLIALIVGRRYKINTDEFKVVESEWV